MFLPPLLSAALVVLCMASTRIHANVLDVQYVVGVASGPLASPLSPEHIRETLVVTADGGREFNCFLPTPSSSVHESEAPALVEMEPLDSMSANVYDTIVPEEFLQGWESEFRSALRTCIIKKKGFWSYEICPFESVKQYHLDHSHARNPLFSLGAFDLESSVESSTHSLKNLLSRQSTASIVGFEYFQHFDGGSDGRATIVHYVCPAWILGSDLPPRNWKNNRVLQIDEFEPLKYEILVETSLVCLERGPSSTTLAPVNIGAIKASRSRAMPPADRAIHLLDSLNGTCTTHHAGYWSYKLCFGKGLSQFHLEQVKRSSDDGSTAQFETRIQMEYSLGQFDGASMVLVNASDPRDSFLSTMYGNGSPCELVSAKRSTELRFTCNEHISSTSLASVTETSTCNYLALIETPVLCGHPSFIAKKRETLQIQCTPKEYGMYYV